MENDLLLPREVDDLLALPRGRAKRLATAGHLPAVVLPTGEIRFMRRDVEAFIRKARSGGTGQTHRGTKGATHAD
jgi:predicted site-specific integrase-resolvase